MTAVAKPEVRTPLIGVTTPSTITEMMTHALDKGASVEQLKELVLLHERVSDRAAAVEFSRALAAFQAECPFIEKRSIAKVTSRKAGVEYSYRYAELDTIAVAVNPILRKYGLAYTWDSEFTEKLLVCTCILRHANGHSERSRFACPADSPAPGMSEQQKHGGALTYAKRQSLCQALGLTMTDPDTDAVDPTPITAEHADELQAFIESIVPAADRESFFKRFFKYMGIEKLGEIRKDDVNKAIKAVEAYDRQRKEKAAKEAAEKAAT